jgi:hypothetical protein
MTGVWMNDIAAYRMDEAAQRVPCSRRWLQQFLANNPADKAGVPFYYTIGNRKMFTDADIDRIRNFNREIIRCQLSSFPRVKASLRTTMAAGRISASLLTEAHALLGPRLQRELSKIGKTKSNVVALPQKKAQHL